MVRCRRVCFVGSFGSFEECLLALPNSLIALMGLPRSGTTLLSRMISAHSAVDGIIEPYQAGRFKKYEETSISVLCKDRKLDIDESRHVLLKETATRIENSRLAVELLKNARAQGVYTGLILVLRSPYESYLSQVEASATLWLEARLPVVSERTFSQFARSSLRGLAHITWHARAQHHRIVSYKQFCAAPANELARLMALFPLRLESQQLKLGKMRNQGGDPKVYKSDCIEFSDRSPEVQKLRQSVRRSPYFQSFELIQRLYEDMPSMADTEVLDRLTEFTVMRT